MPSNVEGISGFPNIDRDPTKAKSPKLLKRFNDTTGGIDPLAKAEIEGLQPYKRGDRFRSDRLWQLNKLESIDKHRLPHTTTLNNLSALTFFEPGGIVSEEIVSLFGSFDESAPIAEYPAFDSTGADAHVNLRAAFDACFSERVPDWLLSTSIVATLEGFHRYIVNKVLPPLRPFLTRH